MTEFSFQNILNKEEYTKVEPNKVLIDPSTGTVEDPNDPLVKIKVASKMMGINIKDPEQDCKKCYGKGYVSIKVDTKEPVPCICIFEKKDRQVNFPIKYNREQRRKIEKQQRKLLGKIKK